MEAGLLSEGQIKDIEKDVIDVVDEAVKFADESPKPVRVQKLALPHCASPSQPQNPCDICLINAKCSRTAKTSS